MGGGGLGGGGEGGFPKGLKNIYDSSEFREELQNHFFAPSSSINDSVQSTELSLQFSFSLFLRESEKIW